jgi:S1-C subfamily serine protease
MAKAFATKLLSLVFIVAGVVAAQSAPSGPVQSAPKPAQSAKPPFDPNAPIQLMPVPSGKEMPAQSAPTRKGIPEIAKGAKPAIVTIVMANNDKPIARGTGFLVRPDGVIVTNYHVIETGNVAMVKFADGAILPVDGILAADKVRDLAIIKIHGNTFQTLTLGNSDQIQVGEEVVAIGNPLGLELTVSNGILSGVRTDEKAGGKFLQVTAPISHGSSGGPLFKMTGEVIGITSMSFEGGENLNFAIPVNDAKRLLLNQSSNLQSLPNEPVPVEAEQADRGQPATMEQQKMCAEQAERAFRQRFPDGQFAGAYVSYTSHYNTVRRVCLVEMSNSRYGPNPSKMVWLFSKMIDDAFGGKDYGFFQKITMPGEEQPRQGACFIYLPGQDSITCKSEEEFDSLALRYLGISP